MSHSNKKSATAKIWSFWLLVLCQTILLSSSAIAGNWTDWLSVNDGKQNGIEFSWRTIRQGELAWRWNNLYTSPVKIKYNIKYSSSDQIKVIENKTVLLQGENSFPESFAHGEQLESVQVGIIQILSDSSPEVKLLLARQQELKNNERNERERQWQTEQRIQREQEEASRQRAERREAQREAQREQEDREYKQSIQTGLQSFKDSVNSGASNYSKSMQQIADANESKRREREENQRAQERQQRRDEELNRQKRQELAKLEQDRREEQERQKKEDERRREVARIAEEDRRKAEVEARRLKGFEVLGSAKEYGDTRDECCDTLFKTPKWRMSAFLIPVCEAKSGLMKNENEDELLKFAGYCTPQKNTDGGYKVKCAVPVTGTCILKK